MDATLQSLRNQGEQFVAGRRWSEAIGCYERILRQAPKDFAALLRLSDLHSLAGHYREGRRHALLAQATGPSEAQAVAELTSRLRTFNEPQAVLQSIKRLGALDQISIPLLLQFAQKLSVLNLQPEALRFIDEAKRGDPGFPATLAARGQVLTYLGRFDEAERELEACIRRAPEIAQPYWLLSRLRTWTAGKNHVEQLRHELQRPGRRPADIALLSYALHKELDDLGRHDEAWSSLVQACRTRREALRYDPAESKGLIDALVSMPVLAPPAAAAPPPSTTTPTPTPIFIVGMHRSGTTLLEQLLAGHSQVRDMGELYDFTAQMRWACDHHCRGVIDNEIVRLAPGVNFAGVGRAYLDGIAWRLQGKSFAVDKLPSNFLNLGFILAALPQARVLHMVRDPMETCFSNLRELFSDANPYSYDQRELAEYFGQYRRLMAHWHERFPGRILDVRYERLVGDSERNVREIADYCGLQYQPAMLEIGAGSRAVATASAVQVRGVITPQKVPKWQAYASQLQPLADRLAELGVLR